MKSSRAIGLAFVLGCFSVEAASITFSGIKERSGTATDANSTPLTITGFISGNPGLVSGVHTTTLTVTNIDLSTGMAGGTGSFKFDLVQSTTAGSVQFRNTSGVLLGTYQPLTVTVTNFQVLSGTGTVNFSKMTSAVIYMLDTAGNTDIINFYDGISTNGTLLKSESRNGVSAHTVALTNATGQSITVFRQAGLVTDYYNGLTFQVDVVVPARTGQVTSAFVDDLDGHVLVYQSNLSGDAGWMLNNALLTGGELDSTTDVAWASADLNLTDASVLNAPVELSGKVTALYYSGKYSGLVWSDQINISLHAAAGGTDTYAGGGLQARGASSSLWKVGWFGVSAVGSGGATNLTGASVDVTTNDLLGVSTSEFKQYRIVYDGTAEGLLALRYDQYNGSIWTTIKTHVVTNYTDSALMGGSTIDSLRFYFRTQDDVVSDIAITQTAPLPKIFYFTLR